MRTLWLPLCCTLLVSAGHAQVLPGDLLVNTHSPPALTHTRADGEIVESHVTNGQPGYAAGILPNGNWIATRFSPSGLIVYDPEADVEVTNVDTPSVVFPVDAEGRSDGTIVVVDFRSSSLVQFDEAGNQLATWPVPGAEWLAWLYVDGDDEVWCSDMCRRDIFHLDANGGLVGTVPVAVPMKDLVVAQDGTLWMVAAKCSPLVYHYQKDGTLLGTFDSGLSCTFSIAITAEGSIWISDGEGGVHRFDDQGTPLGSFTLFSNSSTYTLSTPQRDRIGVNYCQANSNSIGKAGEIIATGSEEAADNDVVLLAVDVPPNETGYVLNSPNQQFVQNAGGSSGNLCVGPGIGRHNKQASNSGGAAMISTELDLTALPRPTGGFHAVQSGETWNFQLWYRDGSTSNFTDGVSITFQ